MILAITGLKTVAFHHTAFPDPVPPSATPENTGSPKHTPLQVARSFEHGAWIRAFVGMTIFGWQTT